MPDNKFQFPSLDDFRNAAALLRPVVCKTPLLESFCLPGLHYKCENLQWTGSFKIRTAYSQLAAAAGAKEHGMVTSSSGNFSQGVAKSASLLGIDAIAVMMERSNPLKVERTRELGARVVFCENRFEARNEMVAKIAKDEHRCVVHPFDRFEAVAVDKGNTVLVLSGGNINPNLASDLFRDRG